MQKKISVNQNCIVLPGAKNAWEGAQLLLSGESHSVARSSPWIYRAGCLSASDSKGLSKLKSQKTG